MYVNRANINTKAIANGSNSFTNSKFYYSSTVRNYDDAWVQRFSDGVKASGKKSNSDVVRIVLAF